jgi:hypothetical protein
MMQSRAYYYLIAGLPELALEQPKLPYTVSSFLEQLSETLSAEDQEAVRLLRYPYDHEALLAIVKQESGAAHPWGCFSRDDLEAGLREPGRLPAYFHDFHAACQEESTPWPELSLENRLTRRYYDYALARAKGFLHDWLTFERDLRNLLAAWNARTYELDLRGQLIGDNEVTRALANSHASDFGLPNDYTYVDRLFQEMEQDQPQQREKGIDLIKWDFIEEATTFYYFTSEVLLGYLLRLMLLERWDGLSATAGRRMLESAVEERAQAALEQPIKTI